MDSIKVIEKDDFEARIYFDEDPESPREWENLGTLICFHGRYNLGDDHNFNQHDYSSWDELEKAILREFGKTSVLLPVYMYDHSMISLSTAPFACRWDSGQVGFIVASLESIRRAWGWKRVSKQRREKVEDSLRSEIETYSNYVNGDVYGFEIYTDDGEEYVDGYWGFYSYTDVIAEAELSLEYEIKQQKTPKVA